MSLISVKPKQWRKKLKFNLLFDKSKSLLNQSQSNQSIVYNKKQNKPFFPRNISCNCIFNNNFKSNASKKDELKRCFKLSNSFQINNTHSKQIINPLDFTFKHSFFSNQYPPIDKKPCAKHINATKIKLAILNLNDNKGSSIQDYLNEIETPKFNSSENNKNKKILNPIMKNSFSFNNCNTYKKVNISFNMNNNRQKMLMLKHRVKKHSV